MALAFDLDASEIHGIYQADFDESLARLLGQTIGTRLAGGRLVVGGDTRESTPSLKEALIAGALSTGCEVYDVGILPTPILYFAKDRLWAEGAVMVTGSNHPPAENGFHFTIGNLPTTELELLEIREVLENRGPFATGGGERYEHDILGAYESFMVARFVPATPQSVVVDTINGTMGEIALGTLRFLGYEVTDCGSLTKDDRTPDPFLPENVGMLSRNVLTNQAQLGVAYDGDGDQVVFADEQGSILTPEQTLVLFARAVLAYQPGSLIVYDANFAGFCSEEIRKVGGKPVPLSAGSMGIKRQMLEQGAVLGADGQGHYYFRAMGGDDALYATLVMLRIVSRYDGALGPIIADLVTDS